MRFLYLLFVCAVAPLVAQVDRATLSGTVRDVSGAVVPGASVAIHSQETGSRRTAQTNASGVYTLSQVAIGV